MVTGSRVMLMLQVIMQMFCFSVQGSAIAKGTVTAHMVMLLQLQWISIKSLQSLTTAGRTEAGSDWRSGEVLQRAGSVS